MREEIIQIEKLAKKGKNDEEFTGAQVFLAPCFNTQILYLLNFAGLLFGKLTVLGDFEILHSIL